MIPNRNTIDTPRIPKKIEITKRYPRDSKKIKEIPKRPWLWLQVGDPDQRCRSKEGYEGDLEGSGTQVPWYPSTQATKCTITQEPTYPSTQVPKYPSTQVPIYLSTQEPKYHNTQIPKHPSTQVPKYPITQVPKYPSTYLSTFPSTRIPIYPSTPTT